MIHDSPARPEFVSVVMPNLNGAATLDAQLASLSRQSYGGPWEIIVADNGSSDGSHAIVRRWQSELSHLTLLDASDRRGVSHARNAGADAAKGDFVVLCDSDDITDPGWLQAMAEAAARHDVVGGWLEPDLLNDPDARSWRPPHPRHELPRALRFLPYAVGANCGVHRRVLEEIGGWREDYVGGSDDIEFCWRAQLAGYSIGFAESAVIHYRYREGLRALWRQFVRYGFMETKLYREFREAGVPRSSTTTAVKEWAWIAWHAPRVLRSASARKGAWVRKAAIRWGRLIGSVRHGVRFL